MLLGFNHNVVYKGEVFHVQTEDSGVKNPHIVTHLFRGGAILCSKKTSYADILIIEYLEAVVEDLMKAQHKEMMRRLKSGEFDERAFPVNTHKVGNYEIPSQKSKVDADSEPASNSKRIDGNVVSPSVTASWPTESNLSMMSERSDHKVVSGISTESPPADNPAKDVANLDEAILNFFGADGKK